MSERNEREKKRLCLLRVNRVVESNNRRIAPQAASVGEDGEVVGHDEQAMNKRWEEDDSDKKELLFFARAQGEEKQTQNKRAVTGRQAENGMREDEEGD